MAVASQQITVKVDPLKEPKKEQSGGGRDMAKESWGGKAGEERWVGVAETGRPPLVLFIRDTPHAADTRILLF